MPPDHDSPDVAQSEAPASTAGWPAATAPGASFDDFLRLALEAQVLRHWRSSPRKTAALVMAAGQPVRLLWQSAQHAPMPVKLGAGVVTIVLLRLLAGLGVRGPWALLFLGGSIAGLGVLVHRNREALADFETAYRKRFDDARTSHEQIVKGHQEGHYTAEQRDLMIDGLLQRLQRQLDEV